MAKDREVADLTFLRYRDGYLGDYYINGIWFELQNGERGWKISLNGHGINGHGIQHSFWISGNEFRSVGGDAWRGPMMIGDVVAKVDSEQRRCVNQLILDWESEPKRGAFC